MDGGRFVRNFPHLHDGYLMKFLIALLFPALLLSACADDPRIEDSKFGQRTDVDTFELDGRPLTCIRIVSTAGGLSCNWEEYNNGR